LGYPLEGVVAN